MRIFLVDAFAEAPFGGNPAGVCVLDEARDDAWMQGVAAEMNVSETAFLEPRADGFGLRWFTPTVEVELCGHATLASAHVLWSEQIAPPEPTIVFHSASGPLTARRVAEGLELDFPAEPAVECAAPAGLVEALGAEARWIGRNRFDYLVELASEAEVRALRPDISALSRIEARGVIVTAPGAEHDCVSRFFAPAAGVDEDPVTGSAHCCLAPYWAARLGRADLVGLQASKRSGVVRMRLDGDRVLLGGRAVTVLRGSLTV
jgi:predicted PhzF superfamily epimerase YddE/YHI9